MTRADAVAALFIAVAMLGFLVSWWFSRLPHERPDTLSNKMTDSRFVWFWLAAALWVAILSVWSLLDLTRTDSWLRAHAKNKTPGLPRALVRLCTKRTYALKAFRFLRQPSRTNPTRPETKSGRAPGRGTTSPVSEKLALNGPW